METELTRKIKQGLSRFRLDMPTVMRTPRYAEEVWTPTGIVDFIRFEDCRINLQSKCKLINYAEYLEPVFAAISPKFTLGECKLAGHTFPNEACKNCIFKDTKYDVGRRVTCFEIKISKEDFKSPNGHNFHGHHNYYVMPHELAHELLYDIPSHVGMIEYFPDSNRFRVLKECVPQESPPELELTIMYNAFKKWVDKFDDKYFRVVQESKFESHPLGKPTRGETLW